MQKLARFFPEMGSDWTHGAILPGGEIENADYVAFTNRLKADYPWMPRDLRAHFGRTFGARTDRIAGGATSLDGLGRYFGGHLYEAEVRYLVEHEWARTAADILYRRTKEYLYLTDDQQQAFTDWFDGTLAKTA